MDVLNDDCLLLVFKELPLHERANLRLVSKRFKRLLDIIAIKKLVVYIRSEPLPGKLAFTNEPYDLADTVRVSDADKFFASPIILHQLKGVQTLVIFGSINQWAIEATFAKLKHLEMNNIYLKSSEILKSTSLECLKLQDGFVINDYSRQRCSVAEGSFRYLGFGDLQSKAIKRMALYGLFESAFYIHLHKSGVCPSLQEINIVAVDFDALIYLSKHCTTLRVIDIIIPKPKEIAQLASKERMQEIANGFPPALSVYLYGVLWTEKTSTNVHYFLERFADLFYFYVPERKLTFNLSKQHTCDLLKIVDRAKCDLRKFCQSIRVLNLIDPQDHFRLRLPNREMDEEVFRRFSNCQGVYFNPTTSLVPFEKFVSFFPDLREITLQSMFNQTYGNINLDLIGARCPRLEKLTVDHWADKKTNFSFLLKLARLVQLKLLLFRPIDSNVLLELLKRARFIKKVDVCFVRPKNHDKSELSAFKKLVNETLGERFKANNLAFCIQIHTNQRGRQFVRYALDYDDDEQNTIDGNDKTVMLQLLDYRA